MTRSGIALEFNQIGYKGFLNEEVETRKVKMLQDRNSPELAHFCRQDKIPQGGNVISCERLNGCELSATISASVRHSIVCPKVTLSFKTCYEHFASQFCEDVKSIEVLWFRGKMVSASIRLWSILAISV